MTEAEKLLYKYYDEDNFEVVDFEDNKKNKLCYIFFSSNGLYKDRNDIEIIKKMHETDRYEWKFISADKEIKQKASRIIYLRDIFKIFYIRGISKKINTIPKICELLTKLTNDMDVILAGSSAGAYMSLLFGNLLPNTKRIIALGGVVDLESFRTFSSYLDDNLDKCKYVNISNRLYGDYWIVNFFGKNNEYDKHNGMLIQSNSNFEYLINVGFDTEVHAPRPSGDDLIRLLTCNNRHLERLKKRINKKSLVSQYTFSTYNLGFFKALSNFVKATVIKAIRRNN